MPTELSPAQTLHNAFAAVARRDWQTLADFVDPKALDSLRQDGLGLTILQAQQVQAGKDPSGGYNPQDVVIADSLARVASEHVPGFPTNPTIAELAALSSRDFFIQWCQSAYGSGARAEIPNLYRRVIGSVTEGADHAYVLYRREVRGVDNGKPYASLPGDVAVMSLRRSDKKWLLSFNHDLGWSVDFEPFPRRDFPLRVSHESLPARVVPPVPDAPSRERLAAQPEPAAVVRAVFAAFNRADWTALATLVDEGQLRSFRDQQIVRLALWPEMREASARAKASGMGATVFMFNDSLSAGEIQKVSTLRVPGFPPSLPLGKLAALSPADFFAEWCKVAYGVKGTGLKTDTRRDVLGQVIESDTVAHALYRAERWYAVQVMSLKWSHGGWKILFNDDIGWIGDLDMVLDRE